jgi:exodeoxyribonuclease VII large subunit
MENKAITLYQLLGQVKSALKNTLPFSWWVMAEISELKVNYSGHCYLELIEKEAAGESIRAKVRATIWSSVFRMLQPYFETTTHSRLTAGIKVMVKVTAEFHELYGFSLNITDIEPSYTIGELALQKQEIINRLIAEGVYEMNKALSLPELPGKIAVISSKTAAGFGDFMDQLTGNPFGYKFYVKLFPAIMQGEEAEQSVINALDRIYEHEQFFDLIVIIRGGGSQSDLNCFNSYWLASHICQFPLPVLTGIGHEQDETIADLVAHTRLKTPTAVAEFLISRFRDADEIINDLSVSLFDIVSETIKEENDRLYKFILVFKPAVKERLSANSGNLRFFGISLTNSVKQLLIKKTGAFNRQDDRLRTITKEYVNNKRHGLEILEKKNSYLDPFLILKRGYSVTYYKGKALKNPVIVPKEEIIETKLAGGILISKTQ